MYGLILACVIGFIALLAGGIYDRRDRISEVYNSPHPESEAENVKV